MQKQKGSSAENRLELNRSEPEWITRILEAYEKIKKENDQCKNPNVRN
jgi:hypothetical protein